MGPDFQTHLRAAGGATEAALDRLLPGGGPAPRLAEAMRYAALGPGKRLRPFLLIEAARLCGAAGDGVVRAAAALEMIHAYSLVHDDLPAMDDDALRRGRPTVHVAYDEATAILAGDALQALAFAVLADPATHPDAGIRAGLVAALADAAGANGMAGGQTLDLAAGRTPPTRDGVIALHGLKTGALFRFACGAGASLAGAPAATRAALERFGGALGLIFQLADDLIDATGEAAAAGKATGKDAARGKATLVALLGADAARRMLDTAIGDAVALLAPFGTGAALLAEAARFAGRRDA